MARQDVHILIDTTIAGVRGASAPWQMRQQVVKHATCYRGQVTTMLRQLRAAPPKSMDLIASYRERAIPSA